MSYHHYNVGLVGLGSAFGGGEVECINKANATPQVMGIEGIISNLAKTWNPTGFFLPQDIQSVLTMLADEAAKAGQAVAAAPLSTSDSESIKAQTFDDMLRKVTDRSKAYTKAIADARAAGANTVRAPAFKDFVLKAMQSIADAYVAATVLECRQGWVVKWLDKGYNAMASVGAFVAKIGGIAVNLAGKVVDAVDTAAGIAGFIIKYAPYAALGVGAYLLYGFVKKRQ